MLLFFFFTQQHLKNTADSSADIGGNFFGFIFMVANKSVYSLNYGFKKSFNHKRGPPSNFCIFVWWYILMHYRGGTRLRCVFNKYLVVGTKFRINAACTCWLQQLISIQITVSWCSTCEPYVAILPLSKKKKDRHSESVRPFGWNVNGKDKWYLLFVLYCMQFASVVNNFFVKKESHPPKGERLNKPNSLFKATSYCS